MTVKLMRYLKRLLSLVILAGVVIGAVMGWRHLAEKRRAGAEKQTKERVIPVVCEKAKKRVFEDVIRLAGNVQAEEHALVSARVPGVLDAIFVDEGDHVEAGKTRLFQTDSLKLTKAVEVAQQQQRVAECSVRERQANLARVQADASKAKIDSERFKRLYEEGATTKDAFETRESQCLQAEASVKHAQASLDLAQEQGRQADSQLTMARKDLADSLVLAPVTGVVSERMLEPGEMANAGTVVLRIEDLSVLEVSCWVPSQYYRSIQVGQTLMRCVVNGVEAEEKVSYVSPTIDRARRTFEVRCLVKEPKPGFVPGAMARIELVIARREGIGIPRPAVMDRASGKVAFILNSDKARQVTVKTGWTTEGYVEILEGLDEGATVVTMGQFLLRDGSTVKVVEEK